MRKIRYLSVLLVALIALLSALPGGAAAAPNPGDPTPNLPVAGVLRVGTEGVYPPYSFHGGDGNPLIGYDVDLIKAIGAEMGVKVEFIETQWDSMFAALGSGRFDLVANQVTRNPDRTALYDLSDTYITTNGAIVVREDDTSITTLDDLKGKSAAENITSNWADLAREAGANVVGVDQFTNAATLLAQGRVDAIVNDELVAKNYLTVNPSAKVKIVGTAGEQGESVFAARKGSGIIDSVNAALKRIQENGEAQKVYDKYFGANPTAAENPRTGWSLVWHNLLPLLKATVTKTIPLTIISFIAGLAIALVVAIGRISPNRLANGLAGAYISVIRGTPLLVQLFVIFYALPELNILINPFPAAALAFSLNVGGYAAEIIRSAIQSVPKGQWEAATTIGMNYRTALRRIVLPQAARTATPPLGNTLISLVKDTSLASAVQVTELLRRSQEIAAPTFDFFTMYLVAAVYYWIICQILSVAQGRVETRLERYVAK